MEVHTIEFDPTPLPTELFISQEYRVGEFAEPTASSDGVSFLPPFRRFIISTTIAAIGTVAPGSEPGAFAATHVTIPLLEIVTQSVGEEGAQCVPDARYLKLREEMVAHGIPMLDDETLLDEIQSRKGIKDGADE